MQISLMDFPFLFFDLRYATAKQSTTKPQLFAALANEAYQ
jgi:hypothetical protein